MSLATQSLYEMAKANVGGGIGDNRFNTAFIMACNNALDELNDEGDLQSRHSHISTVNASITTLGTDDTYILYSGIIFWLVRLGMRPSDPKIANLVFLDTKDMWENAKANKQMRAINDCQATESSSVTRLGYNG